MLVALLLPKLLDRAPDRPAMLTGGILMFGGLILGALEPEFIWLLPVWFILGAGSSLVQTPAGRLLRRSCHEEDRPAVYAAQFSLSHACWLATYPLAGWLGSAAGLPLTFLVLAVIVIAATAMAALVWQSESAEELTHTHEAAEHEHLHSHDEHHQHEHEGWEGPEPHRHPHRHGAITHRHRFVIDYHHRQWP